MWHSEKLINILYRSSVNDNIFYEIVKNNWTSINSIPFDERVIFTTFWEEDNTTILRRLDVLENDKQRRLFINRQTVAMIMLKSKKNMTLLEFSDKKRFERLLVTIANKYPDLVREIISPTDLFIHQTSGHWPVVENAVRTNNVNV